MRTHSGLLVSDGIRKTFTVVLIAWGFIIPSSADVLRLSKVLTEGSPDVERYDFENQGGREILHVAKQAIVTDKDVKSAVRSPNQADSLEVTLTEEGGKKLSAATKGAMGDMRIAVIVDGELVSVPTVIVEIRDQFIIQGLKDFPGEDLDFLGWRIEGKSGDELANLIRKKRMELPTPPPPKVEPEYYSDEEYAALKAEREKVGGFYLDRLPSKEQLDQRLKVGMEKADVVAEFGKPSRYDHNDQKVLTSLEYELAPEKRELAAGLQPDSFKVEFKDGKVSGWSIHRWSSDPRREKPKGKSLRRLRVKLPGEGLADAEFGEAGWIEKVELKLKAGYEKPHAQDYADLVSLVHACSQHAKDSDSIEADCPVIKTLAAGVPELEALRKNTQNKEIPLLKLRDLLHPYVVGEKDFSE